MKAEKLQFGQIYPIISGFSVLPMPDPNYLLGQVKMIFQLPNSQTIKNPGGWIKNENKIKMAL